MKTKHFQHIWARLKNPDNLHMGSRTTAIRNSKWGGWWEVSWHPETDLVLMFPVRSVSLTPRVSILSRGFRDKADLGIDCAGLSWLLTCLGCLQSERSPSLHTCQQAVLLHVSVSGSFSHSCPDFPEGRTHLWAEQPFPPGAASLRGLYQGGRKDARAETGSRGELVDLTTV